MVHEPRGESRLQVVLQSRSGATGRSSCKREARFKSLFYAGAGLINVVDRVVYWRSGD
jgi:hypothetical protein